MLRMRRRQKRVPNTAQRDLGLVNKHCSTEGMARSSGGRFLSDEPWHLYVGEQRVDQYLESRSRGWIVKLRAEMNKLDFTSLEVGYQAMGRRPYHPRTILGLIVYGMLRQKWSLRELEELAALDVGAWWICGGHQPDHSTIGDFIERHKEVLSTEFIEALIADLVGRRGLKVGTVAGDGTVIESMASRYALLSKEAAEQAAHRARREAEEHRGDRRLSDRAEQAERAAQLADERHRDRQRKTRLAGGKVVAGSDPDAVLQPRKDGTRRPSYRPSVLVHESGLIVGHHVHPSSETAAVGPLVEQHEAIFGTKPSTILLDANYHCIELLRDLAEDEVDVLCPAGRTDKGSWQRKGAQGRFSKADFAYDQQRDAYRCPAGQWLEARGRGTDRDGRSYRRYRTGACNRCELRTKCTNNRTGRVLQRYDGEQYKEAMAAVLTQPRARAVYRRRAAIVERPFAEMRLRQGLVRFRRRGIRGTTVEFALHCIAFDLRWAIGRPATLLLLFAGDHNTRPTLVLLLTVDP